MRIGLTYEQAYALPFGELQDLIAVEQIKTEGAKQKKKPADETQEFFRLLAFK